LDSSKQIKGLLFDKDGTLFGFRESWGIWCERVLATLCGDDLPLQQRLAAAAGYDLSNRTFLPGSSIVNAEAGETNRLWADLLTDKTLDDVQAVGLDALQDLPLVPVTDLAPLLQRLRSGGLKTGVATNDFEAGAHGQLREAKVHHLFEFICGFDSGFGSKPGPGMIQAFCDKTGLAPAQVAMIGDSTHDLHAGKSAGAGLRIGVLTGPASRDDLVAHADHVIDSIAALPELLAL
jgi:phosphoglycolate phosphatase